MRAARFVAAGLLGLALTACRVEVTPLELGEARFARAEQQRAKERAPALWQQFEEAKRRAQAAAPESPARADYETEARLWLEAAILEAERQHLSDARLRMERETAAFEQAALRDERERGELAEAAERSAARQFAERQAELSTQRAALAPQHRVKVARSELSAAASALITRSALVLLSLRAWGVDGAALSALDDELERARGLLPKSPEEALRLSDHTFFSGLALLGKLRATAPLPSDAERATLAEALGQTGAEVVRNDRGLSAVLPAAFTGKASALGRELPKLCALATAHPHGPVQIIAAGRAAGAAEAHVRAVREALPRAGCAGARFQVEPLVAAEEDLELTWLSY